MNKNIKMVFIMESNVRDGVGSCSIIVDIGCDSTTGGVTSCLIGAVDTCSDVTVCSFFLDLVFFFLLSSSESLHSTGAKVKT